MKTNQDTKARIQIIKTITKSKKKPTLKKIESASHVNLNPKLKSDN